MDFCPVHLLAVVVPWAAVLGAKEAEAVDLGIPAPDQDAPLPVHSRTTSDDDVPLDDDMGGAEVAADAEEADPVVEWGLSSGVVRGEADEFGDVPASSV